MTAKKVLLLALVAVLAFAQPQPFGIQPLLTTQGVSQYFSDYRQAVTYKKGLTFEATIWPE
jgi:hypothetical protein